MCGILGTININFDQDVLHLIKHRGPDSSGFEKFKINNHELILSMVRLAIVDLSETGHQPMFSSNGKFALVYNGEVYNHLELRAELPEINFKGHSDTETILYFLMKFGMENVHRLNGIFGLAFLDIENEKLYVARDHFGVKPIYYYTDAQSFIFSSEIRPIKYLLDNPKLEPSNLATLLRLRYLPSPLTLYSGIKKIKPGHYLEVDLSVEVISPKEIYFIKTTLQKKEPIEEPIKKYGCYIEEAVKRQLMGDVEVGILLSGGLDSAMVAALAQKHSKTKLKAFTIGFEGDHVEDEIESAKETADILGLEHHSKKIDFENFLSIFKETTRIIEEPLATTSVIPMYYLSKLAAEHVKVVLTGQGADEPLGGYKRYQGELLAHKIPKGLINLAQKPLALLGVKNERALRAVHSLGEKEDVQRFLNVYSIFQRKEIKALLKVEEDKAFGLIQYYYDTMRLNTKKTAVERMMAIDMRMNLADDLLLYTDKITMNFSLECRVPMLDVNLVDFIESLPAKERLTFGKTKIIHKAFAKQVLPDKIINRKKYGFQSPTKVWFNTYNDQIKELLLIPSAFTDVFNVGAVEKVLDEHVMGYNREKQIFLLLGIYYWLSE